MRNSFKVFAILSIFILLFTLSPLSAVADFGDFGGSADYGGGGDWGGGGSWDSDSSWDSGGDYGDSDEISLPGILIILIIVVIVSLRDTAKRKKKRSGGAQIRGAAPTTGLQPMGDIMTWDPDFSGDDVKQRLSNLYVQMQNCWQAKDLSPLRGDFTDQQFAQYDRQLQKYRDAGQTNIVERIAVLGVDLKGVKRDDKNDILVARLRTRVTDYVIDDATGKVVRGSKTAEKFMEYEWTLVRARGGKTRKQEGDEAFHCPSCGAPMDINQSAKCAYCGTVVSKADYDWVIAGIKGLSQRTAG